MKAICIKCHSPGYGKIGLTLGKTYDVVDLHHQWMGDRVETISVVKDDYGNTCWHAEDVLMPLEEWREKRLEELGIADG